MTARIVFDPAAVAQAATDTATVKIVHLGDRVLVFVDRQEYRDWVAQDRAAAALAAEAAQAEAEAQAAALAAQGQGEGAPA